MPTRSARTLTRCWRNLWLLLGRLVSVLRRRLPSRRKDAVFAICKGIIPLTFFRAPTRSARTLTRWLRNLRLLLGRLSSVLRRRLPSRRKGSASALREEIISHARQGEPCARSPFALTYALSHLAPTKHYQCFALRVARPQPLDLGFRSPTVSARNAYALMAQPLVAC